MTRPITLRYLPYMRKVVRETTRQVRRAQLPLVASSLSYTTILSMIPLLAVSFGIFQAFGGLDRIYGLIEPFILANLAEGVSDQVIKLLRQFISNAHASTIGVGGLLGLIITSMTALSSIERAINRVWDAPISRSWFQRISSYWLVITLGPIALAVALGLASVGRFPVANLLPSGTGIFAITVGFFFFVYKWVPHTPVYGKYALFSAVLCSVAFSLARTGYQAYFSQAVSYNKIYGSLAAVPILLLWIYIVWLIILSGAALTAALQAIANKPSERL